MAIQYTIPLPEWSCLFRLLKGYDDGPCLHHVELPHQRISLEAVIAER